MKKSKDSNKVSNIASKTKRPPNEYGVNRLIVDVVPEVIKSVRFDLFRNRILCKSVLPWSEKINREWDQTDTVELQHIAQAAGLNVKQDVIHNAIFRIAHLQEYHPILEYLNGLEWDGKLRLDTWLQNYLGAVGNKKYLQLVGSKFLISAVARIFNPGCKVDTMLILEGKQGRGKSQALEILARRKFYFTDSIYSIENKEVFELIRGKWIVEIPELDAFKNMKATRLKQFVSSATDVYRPPYERYQVRQPRQCVFVGTTNETEYLKDETGGRRFWPIECKNRINKAALALDVDYLWAEATYRFKNHEKWWLEGDDEERLAVKEQTARLEYDPWIYKVDECLIHKFCIERKKIVNIEEILTDPISGFGKDINMITRADRNRIKACTEMLKKYDYSRARVNGEIVRGFIPNSEFDYELPE